MSNVSNLTHYIAWRYMSILGVFWSILVYFRLLNLNKANWSNQSVWKKHYHKEFGSALKI